MLSVIIDATREPGKLAALLGQLTAGAVEGLVREVFIVAPHSEAIAAICDETGAEGADSLEAAIAWAKSDLVLALPAELRLRDGWIGQLADFLAREGTAAVVSGVERGGLVRAAPFGVLVERGRAVRVEPTDLKRLRRQLGLRPARIG